MININRYTLYLDESFTHNSGSNQIFAIGGIIVEDSQKEILVNEVNTLKKNIWGDLSNSTDIILHEKELKDAIGKRVRLEDINPNYRRFRRNKEKVSKIYIELEKILRCNKITTIGCAVDKDALDSNFPLDIANEISLTCLQVIIENFTHFLYKNNSIGKIVYESREAQDRYMLMRFYQIASVGSIYIKPTAIQQRISEIKFLSKRDNNACLQIADFIPSQIARKICGKPIYSNVRDLTKTIFNQSYDGHAGNRERYGVKKVPRIC